MSAYDTDIRTVLGQPARRDDVADAIRQYRELKRENRRLTRGRDEWKHRARAAEAREATA